MMRFLAVGVSHGMEVLLATLQTIYVTLPSSKHQGNLANYDSTMHTRVLGRVLTRSSAIIVPTLLHLTAEVYLHAQAQLLYTAHGK